MKDTNVIKTCYEYFKNIPDMDKFYKLPLPVTEYHNELKQLSMSPIELFIKDYVCLLYTSPSPRDRTRSRMPSSA